MIIICQQCNSSFTTPDKRRKFCSVTCVNQFRAAHPNKGSFKKGAQPWNKGKEIWTVGNKHPNWKGGRRLTDHGYYLIWVGKRKTMLEHRFIMQQHLGRKLLTREHVHHINGNKLDNHISNLELIDWSLHGKQHAIEQWEPGGSLRKRFE